MPQAHEVSERALASISGLVLAGLTLASCALAATQQTASAAEPVAANADEALGLLQEGNERYAAGNAIHPHQNAARRAEVARGRYDLETGVVEFAV